MTTAPRTRNPLATRLVALVLLCAFVLQAAVRASDGCLARVVSGSCCCAVMDAGTAGPAHEKGAASCCAQGLANESPDPSRPSVDTTRACHCTTPESPLAPAAQIPASEAERAFERVLHAPAVAPVACTVPRPALAPDPKAHPPDPLRAQERAPRVDRGAPERLSRLCVWLV